MNPGQQPHWSDKKSLLRQLQKLWDKGRLLQVQCQADDLFPLRLNFKFPGSRDLSDQFNAVRDWISAIQKLHGFRLVYKSVRHRIIGENRLPVEAWVDDLDTTIALLNKQREAAAFAQLIDQTQQRLPPLIPWLNQYPLKALALADDWPKLLDFVCWRQQHADPGMYLRQVSLLLSGADHDISITANDFKTLDQHPGFIEQIKRVFITENEINFLAFPPQRNSLVIFGAGYGFEALAQAAWLASVDIFYWGDIDTHGFAILDQLRARFPHVQSLLMDERTLMAHREFWGMEKTPECRVLPRLTTDEQTLYQALINNHHQSHLRLEQERIQFDDVLAALAAIYGKGGLVQ
jgi:hypothetical protein